MGLLARFSAPAIGPQDAARAIAAGELAVLDVREDNEYRAGRIAGARSLPLSRLDPGALAEGERYVAVCASGMRSGRATRALRKAGFDVINLRGGMHAWERAGLPVEVKRSSKR